MFDTIQAKQNMFHIFSNTPGLHRWQVFQVWPGCETGGLGESVGDETASSQRQEWDPGGRVTGGFDWPSPAPLKRGLNTSRNGGVIKGFYRAVGSPAAEREQ